MLIGARRQPWASMRHSFGPKPSRPHWLQRPSILSERGLDQLAPARATNDHVGSRVSALRLDLCAHGEYSALPGPHSARQFRVGKAESPGQRPNNCSHSPACCGVLCPPAALLSAAVPGLLGVGKCAGAPSRVSHGDLRAVSTDPCSGHPAPIAVEIWHTPGLYMVTPHAVTSRCRWRPRSPVR